MHGMSIPAVGRLMTECWMSAEAAVRGECHDTDEEFVTTLFRIKLGVQVAAASAAGAVESAFLEDLRHAYPSAPNESLSRIAYRLVATVSFPDHTVESRSGGDLGILFVRPDVRQVQYGSSQAIVDHDYTRGLLCQAKMFRRGSKWGRLTDNQQRILPTKLDYFALLLYRFTDHEGDRRELGPFFLAVDTQKNRGSNKWMVGLRQFPGTAGFCSDTRQPDCRRNWNR